MNVRRLLPALSIVAAVLLALGTINSVHASRPAAQAEPSRGYASTTTTVLTLEPLQPTPIGTTPVVIAHLTLDSGVPVKNHLIRVFAYKNRVTQGLTDSTGTARIPLHFNFYPGQYNLVVGFDGTKKEGLQQTAVSTMLTMIPGTVSVRTVPALPGVQFRLNDQVLTTNSDGLVQFSVDHVGTYHVEVLPLAQQDKNSKIEFDRWNNNDVSLYHQFKFPVHRVLEAGFLISYPVNLRYTDKGNAAVDPARIGAVRVRTAGTFYTLNDPTQAWLPTNSILHRVGGILESKPAVYYLDGVTIAGANVVNQGQQRFAVSPNSTWWIQLFLYKARFTASDALFRFPIGSSILLQYPDGAQRELALSQSNPVVQVDSLPRGIYHATVKGAQGLEPSIPLSLSRERQFDLIVLSRLDLGVLAGVPALIALFFLLMGRTGMGDWFRRRGGLARAAGMAVFLLAFLLSSCSPVSAPKPAAPAASAAPSPVAPSPTAQVNQPAAIPVLAYYYIWFDTTSWDKNKIDYPLLGHYSSDDPAVMKQHIEWAKQAGINGFLVSWKSTDRLNARLEALIRIASAENFKLAINYEGLDQQRNPLPAAQVASDLDYFIAHYASSPVFDIFGKPMVVWAGTWKFSPADISGVTQGRRDKLLILASDRDVPGIQRLNGMVDGEAYYFSSVNPDTFPNYQGKLDAMAQATHAAGGLWIAPAAPGFDARAIGGTTVVDRKDGQTLRIEYSAAMKSSPDALGLISWNEFTENSYIEPSVNYGRKYLDVVTNIEQASVPQVAGLDSSAPGSGPLPFPTEALAFGFLGATVLVSAVIIARRH